MDMDIELYVCIYKIDLWCIFVVNMTTPRTHNNEDKAGPRLNIKTVLSTYGDFHVKDKTAVRTSYL